MKILQIGQLPKELGGSYTTGIARVIGELSRYPYGDCDVVVFGTNISETKATALQGYPCRFTGYRFLLWSLLNDVFFHPIRTLREWIEYTKYDGVNPLHMEFLKVNFFRLIREEKPDIIHMHGFGMCALKNANKGFNFPILLTLHGLMWNGDEDDNSPSELKMKSLYQHILPMANQYTTLNVKALSKLQKLGVNSDQIDIIPNGVDTKKFFYSENERNQIRAKFGVKDSERVFITVGLVIDRKGQFQFLQILESLNIEYQYWIIGKGPDYDKIQDYIVDNHIEQKVKLLGYIKDSEIYQYHSAADFYAHASTIEGQALSEIEAYTTGLRIVVNSMIADTVIGDYENDKHRYYVANFDNIDKVDLINWFDNPPIERSTCAKYDWSVIAEQYCKKYVKMKNVKENYEFSTVS